MCRDSQVINYRRRTGRPLTSAHPSLMSPCPVSVVLDSSPQMYAEILSVFPISMTGVISEFGGSKQSILDKQERSCESGSSKMFHKMGESRVSLAACPRC